jgi:mannose-6-phosphate isomerase-like protein (cupin superfamily)
MAVMKTIYAAGMPFIPASHENQVSPGVWKKILAQRDDFQPGRVQMINWARLSPGKGFAPHYHEDMQEIFIIVSGAAQITVGTETAALNRGDAVIIERGEVHRMQSLGQADAEYLAIGITAGTGGRTVVVQQE